MEVIDVVSHTVCFYIIFKNVLNKYNNNLFQFSDLQIHLGYFTQLNYTFHCLEVGYNDDFNIYFEFEMRVMDST